MYMGNLVLKLWQLSAQSMNRVEIVEMLKFRYSEKAIKNWKKCPDSFLNLPAKLIGYTYQLIIATYFLTFIISQDIPFKKKQNKTKNQRKLQHKLQALIRRLPAAAHCLTRKSNGIEWIKNYQKFDGTLHIW